MRGEGGLWGVPACFAEMWAEVLSVPCVRWAQLYHELHDFRASPGRVLKPYRCTNEEPKHKER